jgi:FkbM family methyltransferase
VRPVRDNGVATKRNSTPVGGLTATKLVFDVGLNFGQDTTFYLAQGYRVLAIEADPVLAGQARNKFDQEIQAGRLEILNVGIADKEGLADFWICEEKPEFNSFHRAIASRNGYSHRSIQVPVMRFSTIIERYGTPYFLKVDIEGNDMLCLNDLSPSSLPRYLSVESECPLDEKSASEEDGLRVLQKLHSLGYRKFKLIDQFTFCSLSLPPSFHHRADALAKRALNRLPVPGLGIISRFVIMKHRLEKRFRREFVVGSSGVWGEDTPGQWIGYDEAARAYRFYRERHFQAADAKFHSFWCDWHAKL